MTTRFEHLAIGQFFFIVYTPDIIRAYQKKSLSTAYWINPLNGERVGDKHNIIEVSKAVDVVAISRWGATK